MIRREDITRILDAVRIEEVVGDFVSLRKRGANLLGLCPFHDEKTPSFTVTPVKGIFKCFGCGKAGNAVTFLMEHEHYTYPEALRYLAKKYGVDIVEKEADAEYEKKRNEEEQSYFVHEYAKKWFVSQLWETQKGMSIGLEYFRSRGFSDATIKEFQLGYSPEEYDAFVKNAHANGFADDVLIKNGLCTEEHKTDRFRDRVIFPIFSASGRVLAFGARTMRADKKVAKYLNSPETPIYHKSNVLYGLYFAKNEITKKDLCYLTEGYTDVISLHQAGVVNVVASSGTSLTIEQVKLIKRYTNNITVLYDGDNAGLKASFRAIDMILSEGMNVKTVLFPEGEDPDSFARSHTATELDNYLVQHSVNFIIFKAQTLLKESNDPISRATAIKDIVNSIAIIPDSIIRSEFIKDCSTRFNITEKDLIYEMNKIINARFKKEIKEKDNVEIEIHEEKKLAAVAPLPGTDSMIVDAEKELLRIIINDGDKITTYVSVNDDNREVKVRISAAKHIIDHLEEDELKFLDDKNRQLYDYCKKQLCADGKVNFNTLCSLLPEYLISYAASMENIPYQLSHNWKEKFNIDVKNKDTDETIFSVYVNNAILEYKQLVVRRDIEAKIKEMKNTTDEIELMLLMKDLVILKKIDVDISSRMLSRVIIK